MSLHILAFLLLLFVVHHAPAFQKPAVFKVGGNQKKKKSYNLGEKLSDFSPPDFLRKPIREEGV